MVLGTLSKIKNPPNMKKGGFFGEIEGDRTLDFQDHNLTL